MRRWMLSMGLVLALCAPLWAAEEGPRIVGPDRLPAGQFVALQLVGLPPPPEFETSREVIDWLLAREKSLSEWRVYPRGESSFGEPLPIVGLSRVVVILGPATRAGEYWVVGHVPAIVGVDCLVEHKITVTGEGPEPNPQPGPGPTPGPAKNLTALVVEEGDWTGPQWAVVSSVKCHEWVRRNGHVIRVVDVRTRDESGSVPTDLVPYISRAKQAGLPRVLFLDGDDVMGDAPLPKTEDAFLNLLKKHGAEK